MEMQNPEDVLGSFISEQLDDHTLVGYHVVMEVVDAEGNRSLFESWSPNSTVWERRGWLMHVLSESPSEAEWSSVEEDDD